MALIDKASLLMVPSTYEAGTLYNVLPSGNRAPDSTDQNSGYDQTRADFDFDRGSNAAATRVNADGLIEKYRENLLTESNNFSDSDWNKIRSSVTSGATDPFGGSNAWSFLADTSADQQHYVNATISQSGVGTLSIYAKANGYNWLRLRLPSEEAYFDLANGVTGSSTTGISASMTDSGNGWYRCEVAISDMSSNTNIFIHIAEGDGDIIIGGTPSGNDGLYIYAAQLESGLVATEYLESTSVTGKAGVLIDLPRVDYSSGSGSLLLEPQRANYVRSSEYYDTSANWIISGVSIEDNNTISPEGLQNASKVTINGGASNYMATNISGTGITSGNITISCWAKADSALTIGFNDGMANSNSIDLTTEWKRFEFTWNYTSGSTFLQLDNYFGVSPQNEEKVFYLWGCQAEQGSYATSYIPNHGESGGVTRAADEHNLSDITSLIGTTQGSWFLDWEIADSPTRDDSSVGFELSSNDNRDELNFSVGADGNMRIFVRADNAYSQKYSTTNKSGKWCLVWNGTSLKLFQDGVEVYSDASALVYNDYTTYEGHANLQYKVKQILLFPTALTDAECVTLTTL
jgi:hypothetical protein